MEFRIISLPPFKAATSGVDKQADFSRESVLGKFDAYFSAIKLNARDSFTPRDFLYYDEEQQGLVWIFALSEDISAGENEIIDFEGGYYLTYSYKDGDGEMNDKLCKEALKYIEESDYLELNIRKDHYMMGHIITPAEIIEKQGFAQMETFIPIKIKA